MEAGSSKLEDGWIGRSANARAARTDAKLTSCHPERGRGSSNIHERSENSLPLGETSAKRQ
jgi:hypothetical protein